MIGYIEFEVIEVFSQDYKKEIIHCGVNYRTLYTINNED